MIQFMTQAHEQRIQKHIREMKQNRKKENTTKKQVHGAGVPVVRKSCDEEAFFFASINNRRPESRPYHIS